MLMAETSFSLLHRLRTQPDTDSWRRLVDLYTPLIQGWLRRHAVSSADADDLTQDVMSVVVRELPNFKHNAQRGAFHRRGATLGRERIQQRLPRVGTEDGEVLIFGHGKQKSELGKISMEEQVQSTPVVANGVLYLMTRSKLYAIAKGGTATGVK